MFHETDIHNEDNMFINFQLYVLFILLLYHKISINISLFVFS